MLEIKKRSREDQLAGDITDKMKVIDVNSVWFLLISLVTQWRKHMYSSDVNSVKKMNIILSSQLFFFLFFSTAFNAHRLLKFK